jgi:hypothetical protein
MKVLMVLAVFLLGASAQAVPVLYAGGSPVVPEAGPSEDLLFNFHSSSQTWKILSEITPHRDLNRFGVYHHDGANLVQQMVLDGPAGVGATTTTGFNTTTDYGFYLLNDLNNNYVYDGNDSYLFSERSYTGGSYANDHQWFTLYDVSALGEQNYFFNTTTEDLRFSGCFDYLLFIDDDHTAANWDHNDMVIGVQCEPVPEPTTMLLFGLGLVGAGTLRRKLK